VSSGSGITPRAQDFSAWYNDAIMRAELADYSPVRGCMVIRPNGYAIWELMQRALDDMFKATGHRNAYFPLFIPQSFLAKEAQHVEGFAPEVAVVTHAGGKELDEPLVVRPTSETIIYDSFAKWIQSYRDLPLLINQWCNIVRWEMRTRLFLRTTEFLWQEGHTAHADEADAEREVIRMLGVYRRFAEEWMAMPVITGVKTDSEKFAGALRTYAIEALMQDNKSLQAGTSHHLGQNFAKAFGVKFQTAEGGLDHVWSTSWGVSTRLIGGLIMTHGDDVGIICPPRLAPVQVIMVPIYRSDTERAAVMEVCEKAVAALRGAGVRAEMDAREGMKPGAKYYEHEGRGVPLRLEVGPRDVGQGQVMAAKRTGGKIAVPLTGLVADIQAILEHIQRELFEAAKTRRDQNSRRVTTKAEFIETLNGPGGFVYAGFSGDAAAEAEIKEQTKATIRVIPDAEFRSPDAPATCVWTGRPAQYEAVWAKAY
jgi:prolyl-tRNA synthetase